MTNHSFCKSQITFINRILKVAEDIEEHKQNIFIQLVCFTILPFQLSRKSN